MKPKRFARILTESPNPDGSWRDDPEEAGRADRHKAELTGVDEVQYEQYEYGGETASRNDLGDFEELTKEQYVAKIASLFDPSMDWGAATEQWYDQGFLWVDGKSRILDDGSGFAILLHPRSRTMVRDWSEDAMAWVMSRYD